MRPPLRDRIRSREVARAMMSPSALLLAGAGAGVSLVAGLPLVVAPVAAGLAWTGRVAVAIPRRPRRERIDPFTVGEPWRRFVQGALQARARFAESVRHAPDGPLRERLGEIGTRIDTGVDEVWRIANRGHALTQARKGLNPDAIRRELEAVQQEAGEPWASRASLEQAAAALQAQLRTVERIERVIGEVHSRLRLLDARLTEAVVRTLELSVRARDASAISGVGADIDDVVSEIETLRLAIEETSSAQHDPQDQQRELDRRGRAEGRDLGEAPGGHPPRPDPGDT